MKYTISQTGLPEFEYLNPRSIKEALSLLKINQDQAAILAGGSDLIPELRHRLKSPKYVIDIKNIQELNKIDIKDTEIIIGSATPIENVLQNESIKKHFFALWKSLTELCDRIVRGRATIGGNICTASPAADTAGPLLVHNAKITVESSERGIRVIQLSDFFIGVKKTCLKPDELVISIHLPVKKNSKSYYIKMKRKSEDLSVVGVAAHKWIEPSGERNLLVACTAVAPTPLIFAFKKEINTAPEHDIKQIIYSVVNFILPKISPISDVRGGKEYRLHITDVLIRQVLVEVL